MSYAGLQSLVLAHCDSIHSKIWVAVIVTVKSKQQIWTKQSLPQRYLFVGCQLHSDQALRLLCLKGHVRARARCCDDTLDRKRLNSCALKRLFWPEGVEQPKILPKKPGNALSDLLLM